MRTPSVADLEPQLEALHGASFAWAARCCGGNRQEAEDVLQTTYLKILEGRARYRGRSSLKTWLFGVIRRTAADGRRRRALRERLLGLFGRTQLQHESPAPPDEIVAGGEERQRLSAALERLSPRQAQIVDLVFAHELSVADAAGVLGISVGSARTHYHRAKRQLAALLGEGALP
jgi:RNA polymerase sigma-70 factor (ECF subfamily)